ncbi:hypothetical protein [Mucilaginibacter sp. L3T2-6]|uniref:hypothetical protein n=1 Tax=Mucilaginibacter sp. L3T2-6 TaxID=3062491 RepID=UPI0026775EF4|nr:hypothetical protein [Mucilaginibacter sp. L3T2-6]MDO3645267.1 hypothetical protein [Mucilaginibacter sp. L3T2-6]MDV6217719.1 hypothetical protein [Mucilaginibacter sp. L3T2-6]
MKGEIILNTRKLQAEVDRLRTLEAAQKVSLAAHFSSPSAIFITARNVFTKQRVNGSQTGIKRPDLLTILFCFVLPVVLNRTIFRRANFFVKGLNFLMAKKASRMVTLSNLAQLLKSGKNMIIRIFLKYSTAHLRVNN